MHSSACNCCQSDLCVCFFFFLGFFSRTFKNSYDGENPSVFFIFGAWIADSWLLINRLLFVNSNHIKLCTFVKFLIIFSQMNWTVHNKIHLHKFSFLFVMSLLIYRYLAKRWNLYWRRKIKRVTYLAKQWNLYWWRKIKRVTCIIRLSC